MLEFIKKNLLISQYRKKFIKQFEDVGSLDNDELDSGTSSENDDSLYFSTSSDDEENGSIKKTEKQSRGQFTPIPAIEINENVLGSNSPSHNNSKYFSGTSSALSTPKGSIGRGRKSKVWSSEDEDVFMRAYTEYGSSWRDIQKALPDKTREQIQSHIQYLLRTGKIEDKGVKHRKRRKKDSDNSTILHGTTTTTTNTNNDTQERQLSQYQQQSPLNDGNCMSSYSERNDYDDGDDNQHALQITSSPNDINNLLS